MSVASDRIYVELEPMPIRWMDNIRAESGHDGTVESGDQLHHAKTMEEERDRGGRREGGRGGSNLSSSVSVFAYFASTYLSSSSSSFDSPQLPHFTVFSIPLVFVLFLLLVLFSFSSFSSSSLPVAVFFCLALSLSVSL